MDSNRIREIQKQTAYPNSNSVKSALLQVWNECEQDLKDKWKPIALAPKNGTWVMLLMDSGFTSTPYAVIIAKYDKSYPRGNTWRDHANDSVFDGFETILGWKEWVVPEIDFDPGEGLYLYLKPGQEVLEGDEFERQKDYWVELKTNDIAGWLKITGREALTYESGNRRIRRKIK